MTSSFDERDTILRLAKRIGEVLGKAVQALLGERPDEAQEVLEAGCARVRNELREESERMNDVGGLPGTSDSL